MPTRPKTTAHTLADDFNSPSRGISHDDSLNWAFAVPPSRTRTDIQRLFRLADCLLTAKIHDSNSPQLSVTVGRLWACRGQ